MQPYLVDGSVIDPIPTARNAVFYGDKTIDRSRAGPERLRGWRNGMRKAG